MGPIAMVPVVEYGRRGYRFTGRLRLDGLLLAGEGIETRQPVVAPKGSEPVLIPDYPDPPIRSIRGVEATLQTKRVGVSILCQHHELRDGTTCQKG